MRRLVRDVFQSASRDVGDLLAENLGSGLTQPDAGEAGSSLGNEFGTPTGGSDVGERVKRHVADEPEQAGCHAVVEAKVAQNVTELDPSKAERSGIT